MQFVNHEVSFSNNQLKGAQISLIVMKSRLEIGCDNFFLLFFMYVKAFLILLLQSLNRWLHYKSVSAKRIYKKHTQEKFVSWPKAGLVCWRSVLILK